MRRALVITGLLIAVAVPSHAYVSGGSLLGHRLDNRLKTPTTTQDAGTTSDPLAVDPEIGTMDVREGRNTNNCEPGHPVPEPGTMAITSMGLLAAAAFRRKRAQK